MTKSEVAAVISRIERAPNVSILMKAVDAALGSNAIGINRVGRQWEVSEGGFAIYAASFATVRRRLASYVEDAHTLDEASEDAAPAMVAQPAQMQQGQGKNASPLAMQLKRTVTTHGIVAVDMASVGPCPGFPDHGRDEYRVTVDGTITLTRSLRTEADRKWDSPGARPFISAARTIVRDHRTIVAVADCLAGRKPAMVAQPVQQAQARDLRCPPAPREIRITARGRIGHPCVPTSPEAFRWTVTDGRLSRECTSHQEAVDLADDFRVWGYVVPAVVGQPEPAVETAAPVRVDHVAAILDELVQEDADAAEIAAIYAVGPLGGRKVLAPGRDGIDVFDEGDDSKPYTTLPRGLPPRHARLLIDFWERGYERGLKTGASEIQIGMKRLLGVSAP